MALVNRLRELAEHLQNGELGHKHFDFSSYNIGPVNDNGCGTSGCAIGECPIIWPEYWTFKPNWKDDDIKALPALIKNPDLHVMDAGSLFFDINKREFCQMFVPRSQELFGMPLEDDATKEEVAEGIIEFCNRYESGTL